VRSSGGATAEASSGALFVPPLPLALFPVVCREINVLD
jgi:hypothetical protein